MIKKLCKLCWNVVRSGFSLYSLKNLWCYLTNGYTIDDYTDLDVYLLKTIAQAGQHLLDYECDVTGHLNDTKIRRIVQLARLLYFAELYDLLGVDEKDSLRREFLDLLSEKFFSLWI